MDVLRIAAMAAVVVIHAVAPVVEARTTELGSATWWAANVLDAFTRWCVPVFIMVSGALLLDPAKRMTVRSFYLSGGCIGSAPRWWYGSGCYLGFRALSTATGSAPGRPRAQIASGSVFLHLYFLFILLGLYVVTPYLRVLTLHAPADDVGLHRDHARAGGHRPGDQDAVRAGPAQCGHPLPSLLGYFVAGWLLRDLRPGRARCCWPAWAFSPAGSRSRWAPGWSPTRSAGTAPPAISTDS